MTPGYIGPGLLQGNKDPRPGEWGSDEDIWLPPAKMATPAQNIPTQT